MMRLPDITLVASAIFQIAEKNGTDSVSPGEITNYLATNLGIKMPLHAVVDIIRDLGMVTHTVQTTHKTGRFIVWNDETMTQIKETYLTRYDAFTLRPPDCPEGGFTLEK